MINNNKKQNSYIKHYTNKLLLILATFFILLGVANAGTISDSSGVLTYDSVNVCMADGSTQFTGDVNFGGNEINNVSQLNGDFFVHQENSSDINTKIQLAFNKITLPYEKYVVKVPSGIYDIEEQINLLSGVSLICERGVYFNIVNTSLDHIINVSPRSQLVGCDIHNGISTFDGDMIYIYVEGGHSQQHEVKIENIRLNNVATNFSKGNGIHIETAPRGGSFSFNRFSDITIVGFNNSVLIDVVDSNSTRTTYFNGNWFNNFQLHDYKNGFVVLTNDSDQFNGNIISNYNIQTTSVSENFIKIYGNGYFAFNKIDGFIWDVHDAAVGYKVLDTSTATVYNNNMLSSYLNQSLVTNYDSTQNGFHDMINNIYNSLSIKNKLGIGGTRPNAVLSVSVNGFNGESDNILDIDYNSTMSPIRVRDSLGVTTFEMGKTGETTFEKKVNIKDKLGIGVSSPTTFLDIADVGGTHPAIRVQSQINGEALTVYQNNKICYDGLTCAVYTMYNGTCIVANHGIGEVCIS